MERRSPESRRLEICATRESGSSLRTAMARNSGKCKSVAATRPLSGTDACDRWRADAVWFMVCGWFRVSSVGGREGRKVEGSRCWVQGAYFATASLHGPWPAAPTPATRNQYLVPLVMVLMSALDLVVEIAGTQSNCGASVARSTI